MIFSLEFLPITTSRKRCTRLVGRFFLFHVSLVRLTAIIVIGGSRGRTRQAPPLRDPIFSFRHTNFTKQPCWEFAPPYKVGAPIREILDPPLIVYKVRFLNQRITIPCKGLSITHCIEMCTFYLKCVHFIGLP